MKLASWQALSEFFLSKRPPVGNFTNEKRRTVFAVFLSLLTLGATYVSAIADAVAQPSPQSFLFGYFKRVAVTTMVSICGAAV